MAGTAGTCGDGLLRQYLIAAHEARAKLPELGKAASFEALIAAAKEWR